MFRSLALALPAVLLFLASPLCAQQPPSSPAPLPDSITSSPVRPGVQRVTFSYQDPEATEVYLAGTFNDWNRAKDEMTSAPGGVFSFTLELADGDYQYAFYVNNGKWQHDPKNPNVQDNALTGGKLSVLRLGAPKVVTEDVSTTRVRAFVKAKAGNLLPKNTKVEDVKLTTGSAVVTLSEQAVQRPWRPKEVQAFTKTLLKELGSEQVKSLSVMVDGRALEDYIPGYYRAKRAPRAGASTAGPTAAAPLRQNTSAAAEAPTKGLSGRNIVLWASHGIAFDNKTRLRWEWQRPRLFTTVEDMFPMSFVNPYLIPMLENAGAIVFNCRERDFQTHEVVLDDEDRDTTRGRVEIESRKAKNGFHLSNTKGFRSGLAPFPDGLNPHQEGKTHEALAVTGKPSSTLRWVPAIPEAGRYAVYVSYASRPESATDAHYAVRHAGGVTNFVVNQQMAGNTWVYLGTFDFMKGRDAKGACVELTNASQKAGALISADAVKIGGGMGDIQRGGHVSGYPRYAEGARYWFQYSGINPKLVYAFGSFAGKEYTEDYLSRGEYVNYLMGAPRAPDSDPSFKGLGVPVDLSFAFHTDAGITTGVVGSLSIYTLKSEDRKTSYPDGRDRMLGRDLADLVQSQLAQDIAAKYSTQWTRRELIDRSYAESRLPNVPAMLLEFMSHQNYDDMKFGLDPRFRFDVSRAIYKGMLRFLAAEYGFEAVVEPLAPDHLEVRSIAPDRVRVSWQAVKDPIEPTATPTGYVVYCRKGQGGFDNGTSVSGVAQTSLEVKIPDPNAIYSFRVTATNAGGESLPGEVLAVRIGKKAAKRALIVNAFDRLAPPTLVTGPQREGADRTLDRGVGDGWMHGLVGNQYDFDRSHSWLGNDTPFSNDNPGHGASYSDMETTQELGNTFDFTARHGKAFEACGWGFDSISDEALADSTDSSATLAGYQAVDWLLGEERTTMPPPAHDGKSGVANRMKPDFAAWPAKHQKIVKAYLANGGRLLVSGAYVATDLVASPLAGKQEKAFMKDVLQCDYVSDHATATNNVTAAPTEGPFGGMSPIHISLGLGEDGVYGVELAGGIEGVAKQPPAVLRYADGQVGAAVASDQGGGRRIVMAFPLECVVGEAKRAELLRRSLDYLTRP